MSRSERRLWKDMVGEFEETVDALTAAPPHHHAVLLELISSQQQGFKEKPWVSHFVPHLLVVQERLDKFLHPERPKPLPVPEPERPQMTLLDYFCQEARKTFLRDNPEPPTAPNPFLGTRLALGGPRSLQKTSSVRPSKKSRRKARNWSRSLNPACPLSGTKFLPSPLPSTLV